MPRKGADDGHSKTGAALTASPSPQNSTMPRGGAGHIPICSAEEALALTVQIENIETHLVPVLEEHGCAIIAGVANEDQCKRLEALFAEDLADLIDDAAVSRAGSAVQHVAKNIAEDAKAWPEASMKLLGNIGRCQLRGLPHGRFAWQCRLLDNVRRCYEIVHGRQDLVSSCDNPFFSPALQKAQHENKLWPHVDQNIHDNRFFDDEGVPAGQWDVYQGILYVWSSEGAHASTTVVLPGSHRDMYDDIMKDKSMKKKGSKGAHFSQLSYVSSGISDQLWEPWNVGARRVPVPRGGLFLWSSRTLHQGWTGGPRLAQPVCWEPQPRRHDLALDCKLRLAALGLPSTHWASLGIPHTLVKPEPCTVTEASVSGREVFLPARASIHLASLHPEVDVEEMWRRLAGLSWEELLPEDLREFVKSCLTDTILDAL
jgi:hypothetical protein